jgi:hypothetical protein
VAVGWGGAMLRAEKKTGKGLGVKTACLRPRVVNSAAVAAEVAENSSWSCGRVGKQGRC